MYLFMLWMGKFTLQRTYSCKHIWRKSLVSILGNNLNLDIFKILSFYAWLNLDLEQKYDAKYPRTIQKTNGWNKWGTTWIEASMITLVVRAMGKCSVWISGIYRHVIRLMILNCHVLCRPFLTSIPISLRYHTFLNLSHGWLIQHRLILICLFSEKRCFCQLMIAFLQYSFLGIIQVLCFIFQIFIN